MIDRKKSFWPRKKSFLCQKIVLKILIKVASLAETASNKNKKSVVAKFFLFIYFYFYSQST